MHRLREYPPVTGRELVCREGARGAVPQNGLPTHAQETRSLGSRVVHRNLGCHARIVSITASRVKHTVSSVDTHATTAPNLATASPGSARPDTPMRTASRSPSCPSSRSAATPTPPAASEDNPSSPSASASPTARRRSSTRASPPLPSTPEPTAPSPKPSSRTASTERSPEPSPPDAQRQQRSRSPSTRPTSASSISRPRRASTTTTPCSPDPCRHTDEGPCGWWTRHQPQGPS